MVSCQRYQNLINVRHQQKINNQLTIEKHVLVSNYFCINVFHLLDFDTDNITKYFFPQERGRLSGSKCWYQISLIDDLNSNLHSSLFLVGKKKKKNTHKYCYRMHNYENIINYIRKFKSSTIFAFIGIMIMSQNLGTEPELRVRGGKIHLNPNA